METANRLTVGLNSDAVVAMEQLQQRTSLNKADIINRAVQIYDFLDEQTRQGHQLLLRDEAGEVERVRFL